VTLYWVVTTMTTVGYGDITPTNNLERAYAVVVMILGATVFGYIIGSIAELSSGREDALSTRLCLLRDFCDERGLNARTSSYTTRHYAFFYQEMTAQHDEIGLLHELSPAVKKEVILYIHRELIRSIALYKNPLPDWFVATSVRLLEPQAFCQGASMVGPEEATTHQDMIFVQDGMCESYRPSTVSCAPVTGHGQRRASHEHAIRWLSRRKQKKERMQKERGDDADDESSEEEEVQEDAVLEYITKGMVWGYHLLLQKLQGTKQLVCLRCGMEEPCFVFVLRQSVLSDMISMQPDFAAMIQEVLSDVISHQVIHHGKPPQLPQPSPAKARPKESPSPGQSPRPSPSSSVTVSPQVPSPPPELDVQPFSPQAPSPLRIAGDPFGAASSCEFGGGSGSAESPAGVTDPRERLRSAAAGPEDEYRLQFPVAEDCPEEDRPMPGQSIAVGTGYPPGCLEAAPSPPDGQPPFDGLAPFGSFGTPVGQEAMPHLREGESVPASPSLPNQPHEDPAVLEAMRGRVESGAGTGLLQ